MGQRFVVKAPRRGIRHAPPWGAADMEERVKGEAPGSFDHYPLQPLSLGLDGHVRDEFALCQTGRGQQGLPESLQHGLVVGGESIQAPIQRHVLTVFRCQGCKSFWGCLVRMGKRPPGAMSPFDISIPSEKTVDYPDERFVVRCLYIYGHIYVAFKRH